MELLNPLTVSRGDTLYLRYLQEVACLFSDEIGSPMAIRDTKINGKWRVHTADPYNTSRMPAVGILIEKTTPTVGKMVLFGVCDLFTGMTPGKPLLVGQNGNLLEVVPILTGNQYFWAQQIGVAVSDDLLMIPGNPSMIRYRR